MTNNVILITGSYDHTFLFWDASSGQSSEVNYGEKLMINKIDISQDKRFLVAGGNFFTAHYDINTLRTTPQAIHVYDGYKNNISGIGFMKDSNFYYSCSEDGYVRLHDTRQSVLAREYQEKEQLNSIVLHPNETELIFGDQLGNIRVFDFQQNKVRLKLSPNPEVGIRSITIAQNASQIVAGDSQGNCHQYLMENMDLNEESNYQKIEAHKDYILKTLISADLKYLATCSADKIVKLWTFNEKIDQAPRWELDKSLFGIDLYKDNLGHSKWVWDCAFSCDSEYIITSSSDQTTKIWQTDNGDVIKSLKKHRQAVNCMALNDIAVE